MLCYAKTCDRKIQRDYECGEKSNAKIRHLVYSMLKAVLLSQRARRDGIGVTRSCLTRKVAIAKSKKGLRLWREELCEVSAPNAAKMSAKDR